MVEFQSSLTLTYNATSLQLPGAANIITQPGDVLFAYSRGGGNWKIISYSLASGAAISSAGISRVQVFPTPGSYNFTVPPGVTRVKVTVTGGGCTGLAGTGTTVYGSKLLKQFETQLIGSGFSVSIQFVSNGQNPPFSLDAATIEYSTHDRR